MKVLLVSSDPRLKAPSSHLGKHDVLRASSVHGAIAALRVNRNISLVLFDFMLGQRTCLPLIDFLQSSGPEIPYAILFSSDISRAIRFPQKRFLGVIRISEIEGLLDSLLSGAFGREKHTVNLASGQPGAEAPVSRYQAQLRAVPR
jgi:CheY-like chemotaxis protein